MDAGTLHAILSPACPISSAMCRDAGDKATWSFVPAQGATDPQIAAANALLASLTADSVAPGPAAKAALDTADTTMIRIAEAVSLGLTTWTTADVVAWVNYRRALRVIVSAGTGALPSRPSYPAGT